jgi:hypothetical protein
MWEWMGVLKPSENDYVICGCSLNSELVMLLGAGTSSRELKAAWESSVAGKEDSGREVLEGNEGGKIRFPINIKL